LRDKRVTILPKNGVTDFMQTIILEKQPTKEPFFVLDLGVVTSLYDKWTLTLPMVRTFYAVKCNPEPTLLEAMAAIGFNFDCASRAEIESVMALGVSPDRIIYANPCKAESHIKYAARVGVNVTTFDSKNELDKIRKWHPKCALLVRIKPPEDSEASSPLGSKYGALLEEVTPLLQAAQAANLSVIGVSFHIGSGATQYHPYRGAVAAAKTVFQVAARLGMPRMQVLDIGGGFTAGPQFDQATSILKEAIQTHFNNEPGLTVYGEPGRFFAQSAFTLAATIIGKRVRGDMREYWINDGIYGSFNCILNDHATVTCSALACKSNPGNPTCNGVKKYVSTVFGPTCDGLDTLLIGHLLPELEVDDWLVFPNMGAYGAACGSRFNGFDSSAIMTYLAFSN
ncbi:Orn_DAP_Arg_deC domain-containing protein/Orn_Arg_deC_N domain-containing protein, partial [Cephalotus follicularis]